MLIIASMPLFSWAAHQLPPPPVDTSSALSPNITFSADEQVVTIDYGDETRTFRRPVVSSWNYTTQDDIFWVAPDGNDNNPGTESVPFATIGRGIDAAEAGDIVYIKAGTYVEILTFYRSGTVDRPIIVSAAPGALGKVKITPPEDQYDETVVNIGIPEAVRHLWINGLIIEGPRGRPGAQNDDFGVNGVTWWGFSGEGTRLTNNVIYHHMHCGIKRTNDGSSDGLLIEGNIIFGNGTDGLDHGIYMPSDDARIIGNIIFDNASYGIHGYRTPANMVIKRNIVLDHWASAGLILGGPENEVYNNVLVSNVAGLLYFRGDSNNNIVKNNIIAFNDTESSVDTYLGAPTGNIDDYNGYYPGQADPKIPPGPNNIYEDPRFVDAQNGDYRLQADSPYIDRGTDIGDSFCGAAPDIGAFEACPQRLDPTATATGAPTSTATATGAPTSTATATGAPTSTATATGAPTSTATATDSPTPTFESPPSPTTTDTPNAPQQTATAERETATQRILFLPLVARGRFE
jgi:hypothetical protein